MQSVTTAARPQRPFERGFSLIEILVGLGIGMIGIIVIMQVFTLTEGQKRATSGVGDAQTAGILALYGMERDMRQAGYGLSSLSLFGCNVTLPSGGVVTAMAPVTINPAGIPAGDANTDVVAVIYGNADKAVEGDFIISQTGATYTVRTPSNFVSGDYVLARSTAGVCPALTLTQVAAPPTTTTVTVTTVQAGVANGTLFNLGQAPKILVYAVRGGNLTVCDFMQNNCASAGSVGNSAVWLPIAENIASLKAQYGRDTSGPPMDAITDTFDKTTPTTQCGWARVSAAMLTLAARSGQYDKSLVTPNAPKWYGDPVAPLTAATVLSVPVLGDPFDLSADADWQHYRYKVLQTVVPLRNVGWMGVQSGC